MSVFTFFHVSLVLLFFLGLLAFANYYIYDVNSSAIDVLWFTVVIGNGVGINPPVPLGVIGCGVTLALPRILSFSLFLHAYVDIYRLCLLFCLRHGVDRLPPKYSGLHV